eukprot:6482258-Amphidinium_carterae.1
MDCVCAARNGNPSPQQGVGSVCACLRLYFGRTGGALRLNRNHCCLPQQDGSGPSVAGPRRESSRLCGLWAPVCARCLSSGIAAPASQVLY